MVLGINNGHGEEMVDRFGQTKDMAGAQKYEHKNRYACRKTNVYRHGFVNVNTYLFGCMNMQAKYKYIYLFEENNEPIMAKPGWTCTASTSAAGRPGTVWGCGLHG